uniref:Uncharacterized protein n=1 Tax=Chromera velia CCMP2878 TaxID=1169474 RepID=A0A0G4I0H1_9ALVE|eukprot:Cvel_9951.t1-p1 / transcript=Cvel_9951.t1 / gene=Cvel_9951 / organism=Chromera_velia_CCMP2878 / gene_product=hypothetical protein / transcript_product=hypothetical protein / location=Cvel_scaffold589:15200-20701(+) / protein_length=752 / sequence_SO=supercontig / SO=protein_coding / is_pseudo=false
MFALRSPGGPQQWRDQNPFSSSRKDKFSDAVQNRTDTGVSFTIPLQAGTFGPRPSAIVVSEGVLLPNEPAPSVLPPNAVPPTHTPPSTLKSESSLLNPFLLGPSERPSGRRQARSHAFDSIRSLSRQDTQKEAQVKQTKKGGDGQSAASGSLEKFFSGLFLNSSKSADVGKPSQPADALHSPLGSSSTLSNASALTVFGLFLLLGGILLTVVVVVAIYIRKKHRRERQEAEGGRFLSQEEDEEAWRTERKSCFSHGHLKAAGSKKDRPRPKKGSQQQKDDDREGPRGLALGFAAAAAAAAADAARGESETSGLPRVGAGGHVYVGGGLETPEGSETSSDSEGGRTVEARAAAAEVLVRGPEFALEGMPRSQYLCLDMVIPRGNELILNIPDPLYPFKSLGRAAAASPSSSSIMLSPSPCPSLPPSRRSAPPDAASLCGSSRCGHRDGNGGGEPWSGRGGAKRFRSERRSTVGVFDKNGKRIVEGMIGPSSSPPATREADVGPRGEMRRRAVECVLRACQTGQRLLTAVEMPQPLCVPEWAAGGAGLHGTSASCCVTTSADCAGLEKQRDEGLNFSFAPATGASKASAESAAEVSFLMFDHQGAQYGRLIFSVRQDKGTGSVCLTGRLVQSRKYKENSFPPASFFEDGSDREGPSQKKSKEPREEDVMHISTHGEGEGRELRFFSPGSGLVLAQVGSLPWLIPRNSSVDPLRFYQTRVGQAVDASLVVVSCLLADEVRERFRDTTGEEEREDA